jgi:hypothetical protein
VPGRGIQHIDLAVADVERSLSFYRMMLEPFGLTEYDPDGIRVEVVCDRMDMED